MKKLLVVLSFVLFVWASFWVDIDLQQTISIEQNIWSTNLPDITINFSWDLQEDFTISLGNDKIIFLDSYNWDLDYTISNDHKKITFTDNENEVVTIQGLKIRTYEDTVNNARIGLDIDDDGLVDYNTTKYITVSSDENTDHTKPLPVSNLAYVVDGKDILLSWIRSPSLDTVKQVARIHKNWNFYMDKYLTAGDESILLQDYNPQENSYTLEVYAKDSYYAWETTLVEVWIEEVDEEEIEEIEKYSPEWDSYVITTIATYIDTLIDNKYTEINAEKNKVIEYRNEFVVTLEEFITKTISKTEAKTKFVVSLGKLMPLIK